MPYARPEAAGAQVDSTGSGQQQQQQRVIANLPSSSKRTSPAGPRRIPAPAILPPVLPASATSTLHLALRDPSGSTSESTLSLSKQVDDLISRHRAQLDARGGPNKPVARVKSPAPPPIPPKTDKMTRGPLPVPPQQQHQHQPQQQAVTPPQNDRFYQYQYPASYGPSISKIRTFDAQPPRAGDRADGLPTSLIPGGGAGYRQPQHAGHPYTASQPQPKDTVSRSFAKGGNSILLHKGFFDLLQVQGNQDQPLRPPNVPWSNRQASGNSQGWYGDRPVKPTPTSAMGSLRAVTSPPSMYSSQPLSAANNRPQARGNRRISVDMVSKPMGFTHLVHASDAEQAEQILTRWKVDNKGKLPGEPCYRWNSCSSH